ncbi:MAG: hypothetical protein M3Y48_04760 [Actinomycetota bacterium]|nr:hypothetical protein [Actinomycetota bacterium]
MAINLDRPTQPPGPPLHRSTLRLRHRVDQRRADARWRITDITPRSFTWTGERSPEDQPGWSRQLRMLTTRITTTGADR